VTTCSFWTASASLAARPARHDESALRILNTYPVAFCSRAPSSANLLPYLLSLG
jgi:hypothetical protein